MIQVTLIAILAIILAGIYILTRDSKTEQPRDNSGGYGKEITEKDDKPYIPDDVDHEQDSLID